MSIGSVGFPVGVKRPLVTRKMTGSIFAATCFTVHDPARVAENRLTSLVYMGAS